MAQSRECLALAAAVVTCIASACDSSREETLQVQVVMLQRQLGDARDRQEALEEVLEEVRSKLSDADSHASDLHDAIEELAAAVGEFGDEDWREAVRSVEYASERVESEARSLQSTIADANRAARH